MLSGFFAGLSGFGGQSAPPSLKEINFLAAASVMAGFRGAVRPPFIEGLRLVLSSVGTAAKFRGAVRPPFIEGRQTEDERLTALRVSGGSPPPLH